MKKLIDDIRMDVCKKCACYDKSVEVCRKECLVIDRAIIKNLENRGNCSEVNKYVKDIEV